MRLALLGGTGKLATSFTQQVLQHGYNVASLIPHGTAPHMVHDQLVTTHGSWQDESDVRTIINGCHAVICMPDVQHDAAAMAAIVAEAYRAGVRRLIVVTDVLQHIADHAHIPVAAMLQKTDLDWTIVHAGEVWQEELVTPIHDVAGFVVRQISDMTHLSKTVLVRP